MSTRFSDSPKLQDLCQLRFVRIDLDSQDTAPHSEANIENEQIAGRPMNAKRVCGDS